jgi:hypothetical protein
MTHRYLQSDNWLDAARSALKPGLLVTMVLAILGAVVIYGLFSMGGGGFGAILFRFVGGVGALLWLLLGLTALAHQLHAQVQGEPVANSVEAFRFAWGRGRSLVTIPAWGAGVLLALLLAEMLLLALANIPALGLIWLALIGVPLLLFNTVVAVALILAIFNIAARVAIADADVEGLKDALWNMLRRKLPELLIYNLGGVLATAVAAVIVLSPLWLGAEVTFGIIDYAAHDAMTRTIDATGFWGGIAHLIGLVMLGLLLAAVISVPGVVITYMTLLVHMELQDEERQAAEAAATADAEHATAEEAGEEVTEAEVVTGDDTEAQAEKGAPDESATAEDAAAKKPAAPRKRTTARRRTASATAKKSPSPESKDAGDNDKA